jgi:hypothetical protein
VVLETAHQLALETLPRDEAGAGRVAPVLAVSLGGGAGGAGREGSIALFSKESARGRDKTGHRTLILRFLHLSQAIWLICLAGLVRLVVKDALAAGSPASSLRCGQFWLHRSMIF